MAYQSILLKKELNIERIISIHYFEYMSDFSFPGESHNFWELLCVDKGVINITAGSNDYILQKGDIIFHKPNEFHNVNANGNIAPNLVVIAFECLSPAMEFFNNKILRIGDTERQLLGGLISEAKTVYPHGFDDPWCEKLSRFEQFPFGAEQLIQMYLQQILIQLTREHSLSPSKPQLLKSTKKKSETVIFNKVVSYMEENLYKQLTIAQICKDNLVGRSILQKLFSDYTQCGIIDYFSKLKINTAKQYIRNQHMNFTQISDSLGYTSIHYFSRQFKKITGMTPTEYSSSIKVLAERPV